MIPGIHFKLIVQPVNKVLLVELSQEQNTGEQKVEKQTELTTYIYHSVQREWDEESMIEGRRDHSAYNYW